MSYRHHIHITGAARTGTTLMKNLMHCYMGTFVVPGESGPDTSRAPRGIIVTKYPENGPELYDKYPNLGVIVMVRDPRDMYVSRHQGTRWWVNRERLSSGIFARQVESLLALARDPRTCVVRYEELASEPDKMQQVIADFFDLTVLHPFSDGQRWFLKEDGLGDIRPVNADSVGVWRGNEGLVKSWLRINPEVVSYIKEMGYAEE